jgi:hypothetical protein
MSTTTQHLASWVNIFPFGSGTTPESYVADALGEYACDYDVAAITSALLTEVNTTLQPRGMWLLGNGELIGDVDRPRPADDHGDRSAADDVRELIEGVDGAGGIDFESLADAHDLTTRARHANVHLVNDDGTRGEVIDASGIADPDIAHNFLAGMDAEDLSAEDLGAEPGTVVDLVVTAGQDEDYAELRAARVTLR